MTILTWWASAKVKLATYGAIVAVFLAGLAYAFMRGRGEGEQVATAKADDDKLAQAAQAVKDVQTQQDVVKAVQTMVATLPAAQTPNVDTLNTSGVVTLEEAAQTAPDSASGRLATLATGDAAAMGDVLYGAKANQSSAVQVDGV